MSKSAFLDTLQLLFLLLSLSNYQKYYRSEFRHRDVSASAEFSSLQFRKERKI